MHTIDDNHMLQEKGGDHPEVGDIEDTGARKPLGPLTNQAVTTKRKHSADDEDIGKNWRQVSVFLYLSFFIPFLLRCVSVCLFVFGSNPGIKCVGTQTSDSRKFMIRNFGIGFWTS